MLALLGGKPVIQHQFKPYRSIGEEEVIAAQKVVQSGLLSGFIGGYGEAFLGGPKVREFEALWSEMLGVEHSISMNSATSCLYAAIGAVGVGPGDEVIVSPYTMCASATAILIYNGIPVFADISKDDFNLDLDSVRSKMTSRTKAIVVPNIFGHPARLKELRALADEHKIYLIEDNAQALLATESNSYTGTIGHIGVFSLNYHKHIHTGEGGVCTTSDPLLAENLQLIRNHAEAVVGKMGKAQLVNMIGFNFRLGEIEAAIGIEQIKKAQKLIDGRRQLAERLTLKLRGLEGLTPGFVREGCTHSWYDYPILLDVSKWGEGFRNKLCKALQAEGVPVWPGYVEPLYLLPIYQELIGYGDKGCPFKCPHYQGEVDYSAGICPNVESLQKEELLLFPFCVYELNFEEIDLIAEAFHKVFANLEQVLA
jgi:perosamine synthetase